MPKQRLSPQLRLLRKPLHLPRRLSKRLSLLRLLCKCQRLPPLPSKPLLLSKRLLLRQLLSRKLLPQQRLWWMPQLQSKPLWLLRWSRKLPPRRLLPHQWLSKPRCSLNQL